jgi:hypothetical protein
MGICGELVGLEDPLEFFAPVQADLIDSLMAQYRQERANIEKLAKFVASETGDAVHYFIEGNAGDERLQRALYVDRLFQTEMAFKALDAAYWSKTLALTDVYELMPQARKDEWNRQLTSWREDSRHRNENVPPLPDFTEETVRSTIQSLLAMRASFLAERVDGIFHGLSSTHVTNQPWGFRTRMIISRVLSEYHSTNNSPAGLIADLRCVIAKFMGREEPKWAATYRLIEILKRQWGKWVTIDGGALRIRVYKKGTAHLEVNEAIAYRLNRILAYLHPAAIPAEARAKPKKSAKDFVLMSQPLPFAVLEMLWQMKPARRLLRVDDWRRQAEWDQIPNALQFDFGDHDKAVRAVAEGVLEAIGGVRIKEGFQFDYDPATVIDEIVASGCVPDTLSHQFYPTPDELADEVVALAEIGEGHSCLEPSAGSGALAKRLPKERTTCVEVAGVRCEILRALGLEVHQADFIEWSERAAGAATLFDRIVANPPFSQGRAEAHLVAAATVLRPGGRLVCILPASMQGKDLCLPGTWSVRWAPPRTTNFPGTSVRVAVLVADRVA